MHGIRNAYVFTIKLCTSFTYLYIFVKIENLFYMVKNCIILTVCESPPWSGKFSSRLGIKIKIIHQNKKKKRKSGCNFIQHNIIYTKFVISLNRFKKKQRDVKWKLRSFMFTWCLYYMKVSKKALITTCKRNYKRERKRKTRLLRVCGF